MSLKRMKYSGEFAEVLGIIRAGGAKAFMAINVAMIDTYWAVGELLSNKVANAGWGKGVVEELARWLAAQAPELKGFSASNLWRMRQFYEVYRDDKALAPLVRELPLDPQSPHPWPIQKARGARVLSQPCNQSTMEQARA